MGRGSPGPRQAAADPSREGPSQVLQGSPRAQLRAPQSLDLPVVRPASRQRPGSVSPVHLLARARGQCNRTAERRSQDTGLAPRGARAGAGRVPGVPFGVGPARWHADPSPPRVSVGSETPPAPASCPGQLSAEGARGPDKTVLDLHSWKHAPSTEPPPKTRGPRCISAMTSEARP